MQIESAPPARAACANGTVPLGSGRCGAVTPSFSSSRTSLTMLVTARPAISATTIAASRPSAGASGAASQPGITISPVSREVGRVIHQMPSRRSLALRYLPIASTPDSRFGDPVAAE
jgi:hypothetical protein